MNQERYIYSTNEDLLNYLFDSVGPKGTIKKIIRFTARNAKGITYFNPGLGDLDVETGKSDDLVITDNKDREDFSNGCFCRFRLYRTISRHNGLCDRQHTSPYSFISNRLIGKS